MSFMSRASIENFMVNMARVKTVMRVLIVNTKASKIEVDLHGLRQA